MTTHIDPFWLFFLPSKCTLENLPWLLLFLSFLFFSISIYHWSHPGGPAWGKYYSKQQITKLTINKHNKIPGPCGLPLLGSISLMSSPLAHRRLAATASSCKATRLMAFSLGHTRFLLTCHPDIAKEILTSPFFADRPIKDSAYSLMFNRAIGFAPYGVYWRTLRRIAANHLFSPKQIKSSESHRSDIVNQMIRVFNKLNRPNGFTVREVVKMASLSQMMSSVFGKRYSVDEPNREMEELSELVEEGYELLGTLNWGDHLPWLAELDPQSIRFRCSKLVPKVNRFVSNIIAQHRTAHEQHQTNRDFVDVLLSLQPPDKLSDSDIIAVLWEMIFRGTDTVAAVIEWVLARMVVHPDVQSKVQAEIDEVVGKSRAVTESDVASMVYLPAIVKEVLRLHPPGPLLSWARLATSDTIIDGYHVPKGTTTMVNMWAIARDPHLWTDPLTFMPERFVSDPEFSVLGSDLRLAPFGSGRRACPGKSLGLATVTYWVAALLQHFEWLLPCDKNQIDLSENLKLSCEMATPFTVQVRPRRP